MLTVRTRLTLGFLALLTVLVATLSLLETVQLRGFLTDSAATRLRAQAKPLVDAAATSDLSSRDARALATDLTSADTGALVLAPDGSVLGRPREGTVGFAPPSDVPAGAVARAAAGEKEVDVVRVGDAGRELLALVPEPGSDPSRAVIVLSTSLADEDATARRQLLATLAGLAVVLVIGAVVSPLLVRRSLQPLRRIAVTAEQVAAGDLGRRVQWGGARDEIGSLAESFDRMTAALEDAFAVLARSEQRSRAFVGDASHELRTPLTTIAGFTDVMLRQHLAGDSASSARLLAALRREVDRMQRVVDDLLLLARVDGGLAVDRAPVDLRSVATGVVEQLRAAAGGRQLLVHGGPALAWAVEDRVHRALLNLVSNAIRHTAPDGVVTLTTEMLTDGTAVVTVADDGEGMDEETRRAAFSRFARGSNRRGEGAGLGLAIVAALVGALDGQVQLQSAPGHGTTVRVSLPGVGVQTGARST